MPFSVHSNSLGTRKHDHVSNTGKNPESNAIYRRINNIMNRVVIITIFYEIMLLLIIINWIISTPFGWDKSQIYVLFGYCLPSVIKDVVISLSVTLMVEHNTMRYMRFLNVIQGFKLHYICCCCCYEIINAQIEGFGENIKKRKESDTTTNAVTDIPEMQSGQHGCDVNANKEAKLEVEINGVHHHAQMTITYETHDLSSKHGQLKSQPLEFSVVTPTV